MKIRKKNKSLEDFSAARIKTHIRTLAEDIDYTCTEQELDYVISKLQLYELMPSADIRKQLEMILLGVNRELGGQYIKVYGQKDHKACVIQRKNKFIDSYIDAVNPATGAKYDANANVTSKNVVTLGQELHKDDNIAHNRSMLTEKIAKMFSHDLASQYIKDLTSHVLYKHDETATPGVPYCVAITMYPFLLDGLTKLGGESKAPTNFKSFNGGFVNLVYSIAAQFAGAVATPEYLMYLDHFIRKDYGQNYNEHLDDIVDLSGEGKSLRYVIENGFQQVVHSMNMPSGNRGYQSVFWNVGYFDEHYFKGVFENFVFPDGDTPKWETVSALQKMFMKWFNKERDDYVLTFPVETMAMLADGTDCVDQDYADFAAEMWSEGHSFFCYTSNSVDSLSSCCRLRNEIQKDEVHNDNTHQFSMGTASIATGSKSVMTINLNRVIQDAVNFSGLPVGYPAVKSVVEIAVNDSVKRVQKYQTAFNSIIQDFYDRNMLDVYSAGFISLKKQYLTIGVNGLTDAAEYLGIKVSNNEQYNDFVNTVLETINIANKAAKTKELMFNTEFVPAENLSVKNYNWDKADGYVVSSNRVAYSSYFYNPEDEMLSVLEKMQLHGEDYVKYLDGGSACHINLQEHLSKAQYRQLLRAAITYGTNYFTFNVKNTVCNTCNYRSKDTLKICPKCGSEDLDYLTRIIGYLKRESAFSTPRQVETAMRDYAKI